LGPSPCLIRSTAFASTVNLGSKTVDDRDVTMGANECPVTGFELVISPLGTDALSAPHNGSDEPRGKVALPLLSALQGK
jgi:hypothetical protein